MDNFLIRITKFRKIFYFALGMPLLLGLLYVLISKGFQLPFHIPTSKFQLIMIFSVELFLFYSYIDAYIYFQKKGLIWKLLLSFTAINLLILLYMFVYYRHPERANYTSVILLLKLIPYIFILLSSGFLFSLWKVFNKSLIRIYTNFSFTDNPQISLDQKHLTEILLGVCFLGGLSLRLINLGGFPVYVDEYNHTHDAIQLLKGLPVVWNRAFIPVSIPVYIGFKIFGVSEWAGRVPMVILNMLSIYPLYYLGKKINKFIGLISVVLFTTSPWLIAVSRTMREYAVIPLFFFSTAVFLLDLLEWENISLKQYLFQNKWRILVILLIAGYTFFDPLSIIKINLVNYAIFAFLVFVKLLKQKTSLLIKVTSIILSIGAFVIMLDRSHIINRFLKNGTIFYSTQTLYIKSLTQNLYRQWYSQLPEIGYFIIAIVLLFSLRAIFRKYNKQDFVLLYVSLVFSAILFYLSFILVSPAIPARVRYGALLEYWYLVIVAIFLYLFFRFLSYIFKRHRSVFMVFIFVYLVFFVNYQSIYTVLSFNGGNNFIVTGENHYLTEPAYQMLIPVIKDGDVMLTNAFYYYDELHENRYPNIKRLHYFDLIFKQALSLSDVIRPYPEGWIVLYPNANSEKYGFEFEDFYTDEKIVKYLGNWGQVDIWHWANK